jgi:NTE family protein
MKSIALARQETPTTRCAQTGDAIRVTPVSAHTRCHRTQQRPDFECIALLLQGGGALGAYQAGCYEALSEAGIHPNWVAGISIGAMNSAIIAGNPPQTRVAKLRQFWERITTDTFAGWPPDLLALWLKGDWGRRIASQISASVAVVDGAEGFFGPRPLSPWLQPTGSIEATSYYDIGRLKNTLESLVDFDRINAGDIRFSVGAVNVRSGNFVYFDSTTDIIRPEHVMASGALPPGFAAVEIDGERYWDGGLVSNTPLQWVLDSVPRHDTLAFQVDLWSARGDFPGNLAEVETRRKEIQHSSRSRANTDQFKYAQRIRHTIASLLEQLPDDLKRSPDAILLSKAADHKVYTIAHLIYRARGYEGPAKDYEFSRSSMEAHWTAGYHDTVRTLRHPHLLDRPANHEGVMIYDVERDGRG